MSARERIQGLQTQFALWSVRRTVADPLTMDQTGSNFRTTHYYVSDTVEYRGEEVAVTADNRDPSSGALLRDVPSGREDGIRFDLQLTLERSTNRTTYYTQETSGNIYQEDKETQLPSSEALYVARVARRAARAARRRNPYPRIRF